LIYDPLVNLVIPRCAVYLFYSPSLDRLGVESFSGRSRLPTTCGSTRVFDRRRRANVKRDDYGTEDRASDSAESRCKHEDHVERVPLLILKGYGARCGSRGCALPVNVALAVSCTNECCRVIRNWVSHV